VRGKIYRFCFCLFCIVGLVCGGNICTVWADSETEIPESEGDTPEVQSLFSAGAGTEYEPWLIADAIQLSAITNYLGKEHADKFFKLATNICFSVEDFSAGGKFYNKGAGWYPIGNRGNTNQMFCGNFDGAGYNISNLKIFRRLASDVGLFGYAQGAKIQNLNLDNLDIRGSQNVGGLIGVDEGSLLRSCSVQGKVYAASVCGGLIGAATGSFIQLCRADCQVDATLTTSFEDVYNVAGGLIGFVAGNTTIIECSTAGSVSAWTSSFLGRVSGDAYAGGVVGYLLNSQVSYVSSSSDVYASTSSPTNTGDAFAGGLVAFLHNAYVVNSYAQGGDIEAYSRTGSEDVSGEGVAYVAGLVGYTQVGIIDTCYASNFVIAESDNSLCYAAGLGGGSEGAITRSVALNGIVEAQNTIDIIGIISTNYMGRISALDGIVCSQNLASDGLQIINNTLNVTEFIVSGIDSKDGETCKAEFFESQEIYETLSWNFKTDWFINTNGLPALTWEPEGLTPRGPRIISRTGDTTVAEGESFTLSVSAKGSQTMAYQWFKDGEKLKDFTERTLSVEAATASDQGVYTVLVTNDFGQELSNEILVTVDEPVKGKFSLKYTRNGNFLNIELVSDEDILIMLQTCPDPAKFGWSDWDYLSTGESVSMAIGEDDIMFIRGEELF